MSFSLLFTLNVLGLPVAEALAEAYAVTIPVIDFVPESKTQASPPPEVEVGVETRRLEKALAPLMGALRGLMIEVDPELREFYEWYLEVQRYDAVVMSDMGNGFFVGYALKANGACGQNTDEKQRQRNNC